MLFELTVLGTSAAVPAYGRFCTAQLLRLENHHILIDCGEGTQIQLQKTGEGLNKIDLILISHLHGDHYFGLPGLLTSMILYGREAPLRIISPPGLREKVTLLLELGAYELPFTITFEEITAKDYQLVYHNKQYEVYAFPLQHRIPTNGYLVREVQRPANIRRDAIEDFAIPYQAIPAIKAGADYETTDGKTIPNAELVIPAAPPRTYAFCSDTRYFPELASFVRGVDLLYHEATFLHQDLENAIRTDHSTAREAAMTAQAADVKQLIIGHFSARYPDIHALEQEARTIFGATKAARELMRIVVPYAKRSLF